MISDKIDYNKKYSSQYGDYICIEDSLDILNNKIKIMFLYTGYITSVNIENVLCGNVRDPLYQYMDKEYYSGKGEPVKLIGFSHKKENVIYVKIKFLIYEFETIVSLRCLKTGNIRNPYRPSFHNIGYIGQPGPYLTKHIDCWHGMLSRCYNKNDRRYKWYGEKGVKVCDRWLCFEYFLCDIKLLPNYNEWLNSYNEYQLDKDILQSDIDISNRIYSPQTCMFVLKTDNINQMIIDGRSNNKSIYSGVIVTYNTFITSYSTWISFNGKRYYLGTYSNEIAAANAYNWFIIQNKINRPLNNVQFMTIDQVNSYISLYNGRTKTYINYLEMVKVVNKNEKKTRV